MSILIGHAAGDENGKAANGQAGDQTGREVCVQSWYNGRWNLVLRPKSEVVAEKMASSCEILCRGNLVGYDQWERNTLWDELEKVSWNPSKLKVKCETDCSGLMTACARIAGINIPRVALGGGKYNAPVTQTMRNAFGSTGAFIALTDSKYMTSDKYLKRGDILVRESGHTAMSLGNGELSGVRNSPAVQSKATTSTRNIRASEAATQFDKSIAGTYKATANLNIRNGAGVSKNILTSINAGTCVQCYGYYSTIDNMRWLYVQFAQNSITYTAFACANYLAKQE